jgi:hypothetical protein
VAWKVGPVPKYGPGGVRARHTHGVLDPGRKKRLGYAKYSHMSFPPFRCSFWCYYGLMLFLFSFFLAAANRSEPNIMT